MTPDGLTVVCQLTCRGDEIGADQTVRPGQLLAWLEHGRWAAAEHQKSGIDQLFAQGLLTVVRVQQVGFCAPVDLGQTVQLAVGIGKVGNSSVEIAESMWSTEDPPRCLAELRIVGVALGPDRKPARVPDSLRAVSRPLTPATTLAGMTPTDLERPDFTWSSEVRASEIDLFQHVNHARYADWLDDARRAAERQGLPGGTWPAGRRLQAIAIEYVRELVEGERFDIALQVVGPLELSAAVTVAGDVRARGRMRLAQGPVQTV